MILVVSFIMIMVLYILFKVDNIHEKLEQIIEEINKKGG